MSQQTINQANGKRVFDAIEFADKAHSGQYRPGTELPYMQHLMGALTIAVHYDCSEEIRIAVILHDTVEDTKTKLTDIAKSFGPRVAHLVEAATDDKSMDWYDRKKKKINYIGNSHTKGGATIDERIVICCDKLHNITSIRDNWKRAKEAGIDFWEAFSHDESDYRWYYHELAKAFMENRQGIVTSRMFTEFADVVQEVFGPIENINSCTVSKTSTPEV